MHKISRTMFLVLAALVFQAAGQLARADDRDALRQQVDALVKTVGDLNQRVQALEQKLDGMQARQPVATRVAPPAAAAAAPGLPASAQEAAPAQPATAVGAAVTAAELSHERDKPTPPESWAALKDGMSQAQVTALLGAPTKTFELSGQTVWYYYYRDIGAGSVFFYENGHVASRQKPPFSGWHW